MKDNKYETVAEEFNNNFERHRHKKIVLYGLGQYTKEILEKAKEFQFVGLLSPETADIGKQFFGIEVLAFEHVLDTRPIIVIAARYELEQIILKDIVFLNKTHGIEIYFKDGSIAKQAPECQPHPSWKSDEIELMEKINKYDAVSFDIFDTLISRRIEKPSDVFLVVDKRCKKIYGTSFDYHHLRRDAESRLQNPDRDVCIVDLYKEMSKLKPDFGQHMSEVLTLELEVEANLIVPCSKMIEIYKKLLLKGKPLFLITDMYLPKSFITGILSAHGIDGYRELYVSADYGQNKKSGELFKKIKSYFSGSILHIGDNYLSDVDAALKSGIGAFHVLSARDYLASSSMRGIINADKSIGDRITVGIIAKRIFGNPFIRLDKANGIPVISSHQDFGYLILGPLALGYILWLCKRCKNLGVGKILFCAREGLFLKRLYEMIRLLHGQQELPESEYFRTSRKMASVVSLMGWDDIAHSFDRHRYFGTFKSLMFQRFSVNVSDADEVTNQVVDTRSDLDTVLSMISRYEEQILNQAKRERKAFIKYVNSICNFKDTIFAISDQGNAGTVQMAIEKLIDTSSNLNGLYLCALKDNSSRDLLDEISIEGLNETINPYGLERFDGYLDPTRHSFLKSNHLFESVFTAPEGCYIRCNENGSFENGPKFSNQKNWYYKEKIFLGIRDFFNDYLKADKFHEFESISSDLTDRIFGLIEDGKVLVDEKIKDTFYFDNPYVREKENQISF